MYSDVAFSHDAGGCSTPTGNDSPWLELAGTGRPVTQTWSDAATSVASGNPADITDLRASSTLTVTASPVGAGGTTVTGTTRASTSAVPRLAATVCRARTAIQPEVGGSFDLATPMWVTVSAQGSGRGELQVVAAVEDQAVATMTANRGSGSTTALLPAGGATFNVRTTVTARAAGVRSASFAGSFTIRLAPLGEASPVVGNGRGHVTLGARSCASNRVAAGLTAKVKKAKKVVVKVNGAQRASFQGKKLKKRAFSVPVASSAKAQVTATITLRNGKTVSVSRSYLPCS